MFAEDLTKYKEQLEKEERISVLIEINMPKDVKNILGDLIENLRTFVWMAVNHFYRKHQSILDVIDEESIGGLFKSSISKFLEEPIDKDLVMLTDLVEDTI